MSRLLYFRLNGRLWFALGYASETGCWFLWLGSRCFAFPRRETLTMLGYSKASW